MKKIKNRSKKRRKKINLRIVRKQQKKRKWKKVKDQNLLIRKDRKEIKKKGNLNKNLNQKSQLLKDKKKIQIVKLNCQQFKNRSLKLFKLNQKFYHNP
jgi:hypothetical protein